jgi:dTDP-4-dehydrorhamnose reductase
MYIIVGGSGYLGSYMIKHILEQTEESVLATYCSQRPEFEHVRLEWQQLNIADLADIEKFCQSMQCSAKILYLAAYHHPDKVLQNPETAWHINIVALSHFLNRMPDSCALYYSSTDMVYGESDGMSYFDENAALQPLNEYGQQKQLAEQLVLAKGFSVMRYPFLIGASLTKKKHFYDVIKDTLSSGQKMDMFADSYRSAIDFNQAASLTIQLFDRYVKQPLGVINIAADEALSKYDIALRIAEKNRLDKALAVPISIQEKNEIFIAKRPASVLVSNRKLKHLLHKSSIVIEL